MKTIGILGGMSWESTADYYRLINEMVRERLGGLASAKLVMHSVNFAEYERLMRAGDWEAIGGRLAALGRSLEAAGADCLLIATNTMHKVADEVQAAVGAPLLHIADATGREARRMGVSTIGLLGTRFTMEEDFYAERLREKYGLEVAAPKEADRAEVDRVVFEELCQGRMEDASRRRLVEIIADLAERGAEAAALACTEIPMLVKRRHAELPLIDTTYLHAEAAVDYALGD
jgi:aspartate racemase